MVRKKEKELVSREEFLHAFKFLKGGMERLNHNQVVIRATQIAFVREPSNFNLGSAM